MTGSNLRRAAAAWLQAGRDAVVVEVVATRGSAPREAGARMLVAADGRDATLGTVGGGHLELKAIALARRILAGAAEAPSQAHYPLGPALGQCCGGAVTLAYARLDDAALARWPAAAPLFTLQLHGAGHVGRAVATALAAIDCRVDWFDERDDGFPAATNFGSPWPAHIARIAADTVEAEVRQAPAEACYLVLTHEHALDLRIVEAVLRRGDFAFCGLIGSATKAAQFRRRLAARGVAPEALARLTCPIGLPGIGGKAPELIAAGVVAQLLQARGAARTDSLSRGGPSSASCAKGVESPL